MVEMSAQEAMKVLRMDKERLQILENQKASLNEALEELSSAKTSLTDLPEKEKPAMTPIGGSVFLPAELGGKTVNVSVGAGVVLEKTVDEALELLEKREKRVKQRIEELNEIQNKIKERDQKISGKLRQHLQAQQGQANIERGSTGQGDMPVIG